MWHRMTLFLTWASVVCHRALYHCGQVRVTTSAALPQQDYHLNSATTPLVPQRAQSSFIYLFFLFLRASEMVQRGSPSSNALWMHYWKIARDERHPQTDMPCEYR